MHRIRDRMLTPAGQFSRLAPRVSGQTVLIIQPDHLGDILFSQPAVSEIRRQHPGRRLVAVVGPWSEHIARRTWDVDEVVTLPFPAYDRSRASRNPVTPYSLLGTFAGRLRELGPGTIYVMRPDDWWSAWLGSLITSGEVIAADDPRSASFATRTVSLDLDRHAVARALRIAGVPNDTPIVPDRFPLAYPSDESATTAARSILDEKAVGSDYIVVHPGSGANVKTWPVRAWRTLLTALTVEGLPVVVTGSSSEHELAAAVSEGIPGVTSVAGRTNIDELAEVLRGARLAVGPDSGPMHLAVACNVPTVHLFGPSDPEKFGPWGPASRHIVVSAGWSCPRCGDLSPARPAGCGCMTAISPRHVENEIGRLLDVTA